MFGTSALGGRVRVGVATVPEPVGHACVRREDAPGQRCEPVVPDAQRGQGCEGRGGELRSREVFRPRHRGLLERPGQGETNLTAEPAPAYHMYVDCAKTAGA